MSGCVRGESASGRAETIARLRERESENLATLDDGAAWKHGV